jgi:hypothetical protein
MSEIGYLGRHRLASTIHSYVGNLDTSAHTKAGLAQMSGDKLALKVGTERYLQYRVRAVVVNRRGGGIFDIVSLYTLVDELVGDFGRQAGDTSLCILICTRRCKIIREIGCEWAGCFGSEVRACDTVG